jgi:hypothetical protein
MGRTQTSITQQIEIEEEAFIPFRRALRKADQEIFDELFAAAKFHRAAAGLASRALPMESILFSMLIEERKISKHLQVVSVDDQAKISALKSEYSALKIEVSNLQAEIEKMK